MSLKISEINTIHLTWMSLLRLLHSYKILNTGIRTRTTRINLYWRVLRQIIKPRPSFGYFSTVIYTPPKNVWAFCWFQHINGPRRSRLVTPMMMPCPCPFSSRKRRTFFKFNNFFSKKKNDKFQKYLRSKLKVLNFINFTLWKFRVQLCPKIFL